MVMYDSLFSPSSVLSEQVARQVFEILPETGPIIVILDKDAHHWPSESERFGKLGLSESFLRELTAKVDDGDEPVVTQKDDAGIVAAQLATERTNCGHVLVILPKYSPESTLINIDIIEILLNQIGLIARLIEKNSSLYELQMKHFSIDEEMQASTN